MSKGASFRDAIIPVSMMCLGIYTLLAQMLVTRELVILCLGNELTIGVVFSVWLLLMGIGARLTSSPGNSTTSPANPGGIGLLFLWLAAALPIVLTMLRMGAGLIRPPGEFPSLFRVAGTAVVALIPICIPAGMMFPLGCAAFHRRHDARSISRIYAAEALGSFVAGIIFSFLLIDHFSTAQNALLATTVSLAGAMFNNSSMAGTSFLKRGTTVFLLTLAVFLLPSPWLAMVDKKSSAWRWEALGVTRASTKGQPAVAFKDSIDTRYQNLTLVEASGLFTLYGDGQIMFSFPDAITCERSVNFIMAQHPDARRLLLIGGNPAGHLPFLLAHPLQEVVHVERDPSINDLIQHSALMLIHKTDRDTRLTHVYEDGPRYVKQCKTRFDAILVHSPEPTTSGLNRFYTREFYQDLRAILAPGGFIHTSVEASERLQRDASQMAGSIYRTLSSVFPVVKITAGSPIQFFASDRESRLTDDRLELYRRSESTKVSRLTFRPIYFLDSEEWDPGKVALTRSRLQATDAPINTIHRPVSCRYTLLLWSQYSHSGLERGLRWLERCQSWMLMAIITGIGAIGIISGRITSHRYPFAVTRFAISNTMAATGFGSVALELTLLYTFQGVYGYIYGWMGFMVGLFMLGTVLGAWQIRCVERSSLITVRRIVIACLMLSLVLALAAWAVVTHNSPPKWFLCSLMLATGIVSGMQFVTISRLFIITGIPPETSAGRIWLADYAGSAMGGLIGGVVLPVIFGIPETCILLAVVLSVSLALFMAIPMNIALMPINRE